MQRPKSKNWSEEDRKVFLFDVFIPSADFILCLKRLLVKLKKKSLKDDKDYLN